jgi:hypothetical protein
MFWPDRLDLIALLGLMAYAVWALTGPKGKK